ncbi:MAG: SH3 domain-containing protein [Spirochaetaceae bacterium]
MNIDQISKLASKINVNQYSNIFNVIDAQKTMFDTSHITAAFEAQKAMFDTSYITKALKVQMNIFDTSFITKALKTQMNIFDTSHITAAFEAQKAMFDTSYITAAFEAQKAMFDTSYITAAFEAQKAMFDTSHISDELKTHRNMFNTFDFVTQFVANSDLYEESNLEETFSNAEILDPSSTSTDDIEVRLEQFQQNIIKHITNNKPTIVSLEGFIAITSLILSILFFIYSQYESTELEDKIDSNQVILEEKIDTNQEVNFEKLSLIEKSQSKIVDFMVDYYSVVNQDATFYIVTRTVNIRSKPSTKNEIITVLHPNQKVLLEKRKGKWIYVTFFDYINEITVSGWVYKKYLKML